MGKVCEETVIWISYLDIIMVIITPWYNSYEIHMMECSEEIFVLMRY